MPANDLIVYGDTLASGWENWSWDATVNFANTSLAQSGSRSIALTYSAGWAGLSLRSQSLVNTTSFTGVSFWVYGVPGSELLNFYIQTTDDSGASPGVTFTPAAGQWTQVTVAWPQLGSPGQVARLNWQEYTGSARPSFYIDNVRLAAPCVAAAPPSSASIARSGNAAILTWPAAPGAAGYQVWRGTAPYFDPAASAATAVTVSALTYTEPNCIGDPVTNIYFALVSVNSCGQAAAVSASVAARRRVRLRGHPWAVSDSPPRRSGAVDPLPLETSDMDPDTIPRINLLVAGRWSDYESAGQRRRRQAGALWSLSPGAAGERGDLAARAAGKGMGRRGCRLHDCRRGGRGRWEFRRPLDAHWAMRYGKLRFWAQPTPFRHLGVFPEQAVHWDWASELIRGAHRPVKVLNLFGYTGLATLAAAEAGASVTHLDASQKAMTWARENQTLSGLAERPIRWLVDDAVEVRAPRGAPGARYDGLIIDPPKFGRGPKGEVWKLEESLPALLEACRLLLSERPLFVVLTVYAIRASAVGLQYLLEPVVAGRGGMIEVGEMGVAERGAGRVLSTAIYARWSE